MAQVDLPKISYFRCHVGHQFGPQALAAAQLEASERKLWSAVAALEEQAAVLTSQPAVASSSGGLLDQALTWSRNAAARLATYALAPDDGTCSTTRIVAARLDSSARQRQSSFRHRRPRHRPPQCRGNRVPRESAVIAVSPESGNMGLRFRLDSIRGSGTDQAGASRPKVDAVDSTPARRQLVSDGGRYHNDRR